MIYLMNNCAAQLCVIIQSARNACNITIQKLSATLYYSDINSKRDFEQIRFKGDPAQWYRFKHELDSAPFLCETKKYLSHKPLMWTFIVQCQISAKGPNKLWK